ncbi:restriction endonuclease subunit S [Bacteroides ovatus]|uniref:restriction endonuclease subunit S n=1 Tax=Bacteroides ovatus TaxID=28116 RepID=UPI003B3ADFF0
MVSLQDIATINPKSDPLQNTFIYIDLEAVEKGELRKIQEIMREEAPSRAQRVIDNNDILFQCVRPYQKNNYIHRILNTSNQQWVASTGYAQIRTTELSNYIYHLLNTDEFNRKVMVRCTGSSYPAINSEDLATIHLYYTPDKKEQLKISRLLDLLDKRIATQNKIIDKLQSLIKGLNDSLYAQYGNEVKTSFANIGSSYSGLSGKSAQDFGSGKPFITYLNVYSNNVINEKDFQFVAIRDNEKQNVVEYGDVLFTLSSETPEEVGIGSVYLGKEKVYLNSFCFGIHITNTEVAYSPYLSYYVSSTPFRKFIYPYAQGSTRFNLCKADFEKASIKLPSLENQKRIYSILKHLVSKIGTEKNLLGLYNTQKQYLLRQMFI